MSAHQGTLELRAKRQTEAGERGTVFRRSYVDI